LNYEAAQRVVKRFDQEKKEGKVKDEWVLENRTQNRDRMRRLRLKNKSTEEAGGVTKVISFLENQKYQTSPVHERLAKHKVNISDIL
jgi:hypothetical protein